MRLIAQDAHKHYNSWLPENIRETQDRLFRWKLLNKQKLIGFRWVFFKKTLAFYTCNNSLGLSETPVDQTRPDCEVD